jgi:hypothetical protein
VGIPTGTFSVPRIRLHRPQRGEELPELEVVGTLEPHCEVRTAEGGQQLEAPQLGDCRYIDVLKPGQGSTAYQLIQWHIQRCGY